MIYNHLRWTIKILLKLVAGMTLPLNSNNCLAEKEWITLSRGKGSCHTEGKKEKRLITSACTRLTRTLQYWKNSDTQATPSLSLGQANDVYQEHPSPIPRGPPSIPPQCQTPSTTPGLHSTGRWTAVPPSSAGNGLSFLLHRHETRYTLTAIVSSSSLYPVLVKFKLQGIIESLKYKN